MYTPSKKTFFLALAFAGLSICAFVIFAYIIFSHIRKIDVAMAESKEVAADSEYALKVKKEVADIEDKRTLLDSFFIKEGGEAYFLEDIENEAKKFGLKVSTESIIEGGDRQNGFIPLQVTVRYEGSWSAASSFLKGVETMPIAAKVEGVNLSLSSERGEWSGTAVISVLKATP